MDRFMGMMPSSEIEIEKRFDTGNGFTVTIQAGPNGWTIIYADQSTKFKASDRVKVVRGLELELEVGE